MSSHVLGARVRVTTASSDLYEGEIVAHDVRSKTLVLQTGAPAHEASKGFHDNPSVGLVFLHESFVTDAAAVARPQSPFPVSSFPAVDFENLEKKLEENIKLQEDKLRRRYRAGVLGKVQLLFDSLLKEVRRWQKKNTAKTGAEATGSGREQGTEDPVRWSDGGGESGGGKEVGSGKQEGGETGLDIVVVDQFLVRGPGYNAVELLEAGESGGRGLHCGMWMGRGRGGDSTAGVLGMWWGLHCGSFRS